MTKPGPATSTADTCGGGSAFRRSASATAMSRGDRPAAFADANATFVLQSPCSAIRGLSSTTVAGRSSPSAAHASAIASARPGGTMRAMVRAIPCEARGR